MLLCACVPCSPCVISRVILLTGHNYFMGFTMYSNGNQIRSMIAAFFKIGCA